MSEDWPDVGVSLWRDCYGHHARDATPFKIALADDKAQASFTNMEIYAAADPAKMDLPYIYQHFEWTHCKDEGYDFHDIL